TRLADGVLIWLALVSWLGAQRLEHQFVVIAIVEDRRPSRCVPSPGFAGKGIRGEGFWGFRHQRLHQVGRSPIFQSYQTCFLKLVSAYYSTICLALPSKSIAWL